MLHDAIGGLIIRGCYNAPYIFAQRFVSVSFEQDVQHIDQPGRLAVGRKHGQTIIAIRNMLAAVDLPVVRLVRTQFGPLRLDRLAPGSYRKLSQAEVAALYKAVGL